MGPCASGAEREQLGQELLRVHAQLRARIGSLESSIGESTTGAGPVDVDSFRTSCLAFCRVLRRHHVGEDEGTFPVLRRHDPELGAVLDDLARDHAFLDPTLDRLELLAADEPRDPAVEREIAGIAAVLENHLAYEERTLVSVLNALVVERGRRRTRRCGRRSTRSSIQPTGEVAGSA